MGQVTHEQVNLMLHLYEMRREPVMREARAWFIANFHPQTPEDVLKICPPGSKENSYLRQVASYWEMVANIVSRGLIDEEFFFENSGEQWVVWECIRPIAAGWRALQESSRVVEARGALHALRGVARETRSRLQCRDATDACRDVGEKGPGETSLCVARQEEEKRDDNRISNKLCNFVAIASWRW